jgi:hypothetical protein
MLKDLNTVLKEYYQALTKTAKWTILVVSLGVVMNGALALVSRYQLNNATKTKQEAERLRVLGTEAWKESFKLKEYADKVTLDLKKANAKIDKLQAAVDKINVPPKPGPAPESSKQLVSDLQGMGLELVVKPSTTITPSLVGITIGDGKMIWGWGKENLRVPALEQKIEGYANLVAGLQKAKTLAETLADARAKEADSALKAADSFKHEADLQKEVAVKVRKALAAEQKRKILYGIGGLAAGYYTHKLITK